MMANMPICTHLSNQILSSQSSFGNDEPGNVNNIVEMINQAMAGVKEGFIVFNDIVSAILRQAQQTKVSEINTRDWICFFEKATRSLRGIDL
jgi:hypothetical protein